MKTHNNFPPESEGGGFGGRKVGVPPNPRVFGLQPGASITENGPAPDTIAVTIAQGTAPHLFARLRVTIAP